MTTLKQVTIYTDGGCQGNPGPGGYGAVLLCGNHRKELSGGYKLTTNNRMELLACIAALEALKYKCDVTVYSDSKYVVDSFEKGWAKRWRTNGWKRNKKDKAENPDLWERLLDLSEQHEVKFRWVKGHAGNIENERCDRMAAEAAKQDNLQEDKKYEETARLTVQNSTNSLF
ncbi:ribonuclease HI [Candidatus Electrothrix sp.]|uniref:ribonuclease HI n=1 Tax=Candidatus Electrothrix sp. TaxID=2170559 RepID=UPI004057517E